MLRITEGSATDGTTMLYLEGQVVGPWLAELRRCCELVLATSRRLIVDLADVSFVDRDGVSLLKELTVRDVAIANCTPFVAEQLKAVGQFRHIDPTGDTRRSATSSTEEV
ncbi:MAG TPA: STAS domain-containing protein [Blastocatellia bacterium]|nr:STAS domain-containing protein [Blastocatellia bacterium]